MPELVHLTPADSRRVPWKNGRGVTEELAIWPAGAAFERGDFDWRISKASVADGGPFSAFPGFERVLVVTDGDGLVVSHGDAAPRARVGLLAPYRFDGEWTTTAELIGGPVRDFNVMTRRGRVRADVQVMRRSGEFALARGHAFVHVLCGEVALRVGGGAAGLAALDSLRIQDVRDGDALDVRSRGECVVLSVRITPV